MTRLLKPTRSNRLESVQFALKSDLKSESREPYVQKLVNSFDACVRGRALSAAIGETGGVAVQAEIEFSLSRLKGEPTEFEKFRRAFAYRYWSVELTINERRIREIPDTSRDDSLLETLSMQGLSLACGLNWFADWTAPYLANLLRTTDVQDYFAFFLDTPAHFFFSTLQSVLVKRQWPLFNPEETQKAGMFGRILQCAGDKAAFEVALNDYCDYRVAQALGYAGIDAEKRRRPSQLESIFDMMGWAKVFPVELFTLQYAYQISTGSDLSLESDHPLMHTALMSRPFPNLEPLYDDAMTQTIATLGQTSFGNQWTLREPIVMK